MCDSHPWGDSMGFACMRTDVHATGHIYGATEPGDTHYEPTEGDH